MFYVYYTEMNSSVGKVFLGGKIEYDNNVLYISMSSL